MSERLEEQNEFLRGAVEALKEYIKEEDVVNAQKRYKYLDKLVRGTDLERAFILGLEHPGVPLCHERLRLIKFLITMNALP